MLSSRPYLARGLYEWLLDNELTPYIVVDAEREGVRVPQQFIQNGQIVLNIAPTAVRELNMANDVLGFDARFGGHPMQVLVPFDAVIALYAKENGVGMVFGHEPVMPGYDEAMAQEAKQKEERPVLESVDTSEEDSTSSDAGKKQSDDKEKESGKERPSLRVIK
ncbi:ClpXP protease specificity-enhancing factor [Halomonas sp. PR-M31]|uniref:ClpXP protease specificity-enhancing factor n=1 Tax=Halomonas sp. PR-M31 TaxID=1471202 RepID=UPI000650ED21|nr:ClpXP protease specificity-enhancing factor [Halomonas sp. PR-M31]